MSTIRSNLIAGTVSENPLGSSTTTLTMAGDLLNLPTVTAPDIARLIIDPEGTDVLAGSGPEIVYVTDYTSGAGSATVVRGAEAIFGVASERPHSQGVKVIHAPTVVDWDEKADLTGATFTGGLNVPSLHVAGNANIDGGATIAGIHVTGTSAQDGDAAFGGTVSIPNAIATTLTVTNRVTANGGIETPQGVAAIEDTTTGDRLFYHDAVYLYLGDIDNTASAPHGVMLRTSGADRVSVSSAGDMVFRASPGTTHESFRADGFAQMSARGLMVAADAATFQGSVTAGISVAINRAQPAVSINNAGGDSLQTYAGVNQTSRIDSTGSAFFAGRVSADPTGVNSASFADNDNHAWESDGSGGWRLACRGATSAAVFRFYGGSAVAELMRIVGDLGALDASFFTRWKDGGGAEAFSQVGVRQIGTMKGTSIYDSSYVLVVG